MANDRFRTKINLPNGEYYQHLKRERDIENKNQNLQSEKIKAKKTSNESAGDKP